MRWILPILAATFCFVGVARFSPTSSPLQAGTAVRMELEDLVDHADQIVEARITGRCTTTDAAGRIVTEYQLLKRREFFGSSADVVRIPGGVLATGRGMMIPGMPRIQVGEEVLLFLNGEGTQMPTGLAQGKFRIVQGRSGQKLAVRQGGGLELIASAHGAHAGQPCSEIHGCGEGGVQALPYAELSARVQARVIDRLAREAFDASSTPR